MTLTLDQIDKLKPDELPAAVAVHVMGWKRVRDEDFDGTDFWLAKDGLGIEACDWNPHNDANDALRAVKKIYVMGSIVNVFFYLSHDEWGVEIVKSFSRRILSDEVFNKSLCIAICRAALNAVVEMGEVSA